MASSCAAVKATTVKTAEVARAAKVALWPMIKAGRVIKLMVFPGMMDREAGLAAVNTIPVRRITVCRVSVIVVIRWPAPARENSDEAEEQ
jgi:hypothetical protein